MCVGICVCVCVCVCDCVCVYIFWFACVTSPFIVPRKDVYYRFKMNDEINMSLSLPCVFVSSAPRPFAQTGPREMSVGQGSFVRLPLPDINTLGMEITWQENNVTLDADGPYNFISLNKDLILLSVDNNHNKEYRAKVVYFMTAFESISSPYNVRVIGKFIFLSADAHALNPFELLLFIVEFCVSLNCMPYCLVLH